MNFSGIFHCYNCYKSNKMKKQYYEVWLSLKKNRVPLKKYF